MKFTVTQENILKGLQFVIGVVEKRQTMAVLSNLLIKCETDKISIIGTDLEIELTSYVIPETVITPGEITLPGRKLLDICRLLSPDELVSFEVYPEKQKASIRSGKSQYSLSTIPASEFPLMESSKEKLKFVLSETQLSSLLAATHFSMAQQDVRYYLNGLYLDISAGSLNAVATDGHRLAMKRFSLPGEEKANIILPRKGVLELLRLIDAGSEEHLDILWAENTVKIQNQKFIFVSRLIEGRFPDYERVIPKNADKLATVSKDKLKQVLQRVAILTHEKHHAARLHFSSHLLTVNATNTEQEEALEELSIQYEGENTEIAFNIHYLLDVLNVMPEGEVQFHFSKPNNSTLLTASSLPETLYVIMPMSL